MSVINTLRERIDSFEELTNLKLLNKLPVIIILNGRSFKKVTSLLNKPFDPKFMELMCGTMIKLSQEIDGAFFSYCYNDEIIIISRNDQTIDTEPYYGNSIQKIVSASAAIATFEFNRLARTNNVQIFGDPIFTAKTFVVPNIMEAINTLIMKQQSCFHSALSMACFYELLKKYDLDTVKQTLLGKSTSSSKAEILFEVCGIDFNIYPLPFKRGVACYRAPKIINFEGDEKIKNSFIIDKEVPIFTKNHDFLRSIFRDGRDIFRV